KAEYFGAYPNSDAFKLPAKIKWFGNQATDGDYGFLEIPELGDVFFHYKSVRDIPREGLRAERLVIVELSKEDLQVNKKKSAKSLSLPENETDLNFILHCYSALFNSVYRNNKEFFSGSGSILQLFKKRLEILK